MLSRLAEAGCGGGAQDRASSVTRPEAVFLDGCAFFWGCSSCKVPIEDADSGFNLLNWTPREGITRVSTHGLKEPLCRLDNEISDVAWGNE